MGREASTESPVSSVRPPDPGEAVFWSRAGGRWRRLGGSFAERGFSFEWHELAAPAGLDWTGSFHPSSVEVCLNLEGSAWVNPSGERIDFDSGSAGFFVINGAPAKGARAPGHSHKFLTVEYALDFLRAKLGDYRSVLNPALADCLIGKRSGAVSPPLPLAHRHRDLLRSVLHPPVLLTAQRLWYESKALEFAAEFFFGGHGEEPLCTRSRRVAAERVAKAKRILLDQLAQPLSLEELGRLVGCSHFYLSRTFTRETGLTISQWLRQARLERAAELLRSGKFNVTEAALEVGYSSLSHFSQAFHERYGCCPGLFPLRTITQRKDQGGPELPDKKTAPSLERAVENLLAS